MQARLDFYKANPVAMKAMVNLDLASKQGALERPLKDLVRLRASQINGCAFCVDLHVQEAREAGETERRLATLVVWRESPLFSERERAALAWTEALTLIAADRVPEAVWDSVRPHFSEAELVELTLDIVAINGWNRFAVAFRKLPAGGA
jgi:AhpD family alkylhydroperoxidase